MRYPRVGLLVPIALGGCRDLRAEGFKGAASDRPAATCLRKP